MNMWKDIKLKNVSGIDKLVSEFQVWMVGVLPYAKMKVRIYQEQNKNFVGYTDALIKTKFDESFEGAVGHGHNVDEVLESTIQNFNEKLEENFPNLGELGLEENDIEYAEWSGF